MKKVFLDGEGMALFIENMPKCHTIFLHDTKHPCTFMDGEKTETTIFTRENETSWHAVRSDGCSYGVSEFYLLEELFDFYARAVETYPTNGSMLCYE